MEAPPSQPSTPPSDEQLLLWHRQGHEEALATLIERYRLELFHFLMRFVGNRAAAEDLFQETFLQVHLSADTFDLDRRFKPWLFTIAANKARDHLRRNQRRQTVALSAPIAGPHQEQGQSFVDLLQADLTLPPEALEQQETRQLVQDVVDELADPLREILILAYFHQFPYREIARMLNIPLGTVKSRLHTAVATFARKWKQRYPAQVDPPTNSTASPHPREPDRPANST